MQQVAVPVRRRHAASTDYAVTAAATGGQIALSLLLFHLIATRTGPSGFSYYALARNLISVGQPIVGVGLAISVMRFLPMAPQQRPLRLGVAGAQVCYLALGLVLVVSAQHLVPHSMAPTYGSGVVPAYVALCGVVLTSLASTMLRGIHRPGTANAVMLVGLGIIPLLSFLLTRDIAAMLVVQGALAGTVAAATLLMPAGPQVLPPEHQPPLRRLLRSVIGFGWRRVPGDAALPAIFATPTVWVAHTGGLPTEVSAIGFASSTALLGLAAFGLLTPVLLPRLSSTSLESGERRRALFLRLQLACAAVAAVGYVVVLVLGGPIVAVFLGPDFSEAARVLRVGVVTTVPVAAFYAARPLLETVSDRSVTTRILVTAWIVEIATTVVASRRLGDLDGAITGWIAGSFTAGALAFLTVSSWRRIGPA